MIVSIGFIPCDVRCLDRSMGFSCVPRHQVPAETVVRSRKRDRYI
jgi:hypothetical protein